MTDILSKYLYIPLCSKDFTFENIFSTESISPNNFYTNRTFGIKYFFFLPELSDNDLIILFDSPPLYDIKNIGLGLTKFILEVSVEELEQAYLNQYSSGIFSYSKTIYLSPDNFKLLFFSDKDIKQSQLKSENSLPTKSFEKYKNNFKVISEKTCLKFNISEIIFNKPSPEFLSKQLEIDKKFNAFKGFVYGLYVGKLRSNNSESITLARKLQEVLDFFGEFKSRLESDGNSRVLAGSLERVKNAITKSFSLYSKGEAFTEIDEFQLAEYLIAQFPQRFIAHEDAQKFINDIIVRDAIFKTNEFESLQRYLSSIQPQNSTVVKYNLLPQKIDEYLKIAKLKPSLSTKKSKEKLDTEFKDSVYYLIDEANKNEEISAAFHVPLEEIIFDTEVYNISFSKSCALFEPEFLEEYNVILNYVYLLSKKKNGELLKADLLLLVENIENSYKQKTSAGKSNLYKYLNNQIDFYSIDAVPSFVMKNFIAFIFNHSNLNNLINYLESKEISNSWIAYSFWCCLNGFSNINGNFIKVLFSNNSLKHQTIIDTYLLKIRKQFYQENDYEAAKSTDNQVETFSDGLQELSSKYSIPAKELISLSKESLKTFSATLKAKYGIKSGVKVLYSSLKEINNPSLFK